MPIPVIATLFMQQVSPLRKSLNFLAYLVYKNSNNYVAELNSQFYNVTEVELISMYYKFSNYEFNNNNNKLFITNNTTNDNISISIGIGNKKKKKMVDHLTYKLNSYFSIKNINYEITPKYSSVLDRFYFMINI